MHWIDYVLVLIPIFIVIYIGVKCQKYVRGVTDFLAAGRVAKRYVLSVASFEAGMGLITIIAVIESNYLCGFAVNFWYNLVMPIAMILALTGYCQYRYRETRAMTMGQFLEMRYNRSFRVFASAMQALSGILNYAIFPAVAARFLIYFLDLPHRFNLWGMEISTYALAMFITLSIAVAICFMGGQLTIMVTDCIQGILSYPMYVIIVGYLIYRFSLNGEMIPTLANRVEGESFLDPYKTAKLREFNLFFLFVGVVSLILNRMGMGAAAGYSAAAISPHEQKMGTLLGTWRSGFSNIMMVLLAVAGITYLNHPNYSEEAKHVRVELSQKVSEDVLRNVPAQERAELQQSFKEIDPQLKDANGNVTPLSQAKNPDKLYTGKVKDEGKEHNWDPKSTQKFNSIYSQMLLPVALREMLPIGITGIFCAMMLFMLISTDTTYMHSWGGVIMQDLIMPWRKKKLSSKAHLWGLRLCILFVAVFAFLFSLLFEQMDYIMMFFQITGAIWMGGGGTVIVFGLYSRFGNSAGAFASLITGVVMSIGGFIVQQLWPGSIYPYLEAKGWAPSIGRFLEVVSSPFHPYVKWEMDPSKFPINSREILFLAMIFSVIAYIVFSLLIGRKKFNLDKMLHRNEYADEKSSKLDGSGWTWKNFYNKFIGITNEYTLGDRILAWSVFIWSFGYRFILIFLLVVLANAIRPWSTAAWGSYFNWTQVYIVGIIGIVSTIWFMWGGIKDLRSLFRDLEARDQIVDEDGRVERDPEK